MVSQSDANKLIEQELDTRIQNLEECFDADAIAYVGGIVEGVDDAIRDLVELHAPSTPRNRLIVILTTGGGYIETVARIVETLRNFYKTVEFVIPNRAFSAGTVFALSGNAIHMDYYSRLGPIDPQVETTDGEQVPALGYLVKYNELLEKANSARISAAEAAVLLEFDQAELYKFEQSRELSVSLLKEWLANYKFRDWKITEGRGKDVTDQMRQERAESIAQLLSDTNRWHSHGYGISMEVLRKELKLVIDDFGENPDTRRTVKAYDDLLQDYLSKRGIVNALHACGNFVDLARHQP